MNFNVGKVTKLDGVTAGRTEVFMQGKPDGATKSHALRRVKFAVGLMINVGGMLAVAQTLLS